MSKTFIHMDQAIVTVTTDFNEHFATAQMEGVLYGINPKARFVSVTDRIIPFNILEGAFVIMQTSRFFPAGSIHVGVVDPGVGSARRVVVIKTHQSYFIGPDNGLFYPTVKNQVFEWAYQIDPEMFPNSSNTFHGRDIFIKLAANLSNGVDMARLGNKIDMADLVKLEFVPGQVVHLDGFGNIKVNMPPLAIPYGTEITVQLRDKSFTARYQRTLSDVGIGEWVVYVGSHDILEIAMNQGHAMKVLGARIGDIAAIEVSPDAFTQQGPTLFDLKQ